MDVKIFDETPNFLTALRELNVKDEEACAHEFRTVIQDCLNSRPSGQCSGNYSYVYGAILDRVAFFPLKPAVMQEELVRLGLNQPLSDTLAEVWALNAKDVVLSRKKVVSDVKAVDFEVLIDLKSKAENVNIHISDYSDRALVLNFNVEELLTFYKQIEDIQASIDQICK